MQRLALLEADAASEQCSETIVVEGAAGILSQATRLTEHLEHLLHSRPDQALHVHKVLHITQYTAQVCALPFYLPSRQRNKQDTLSSTQMTETLQEDDRKRLRAAENLGWLAASGTYSKKRKLIEGARFLHTSLAPMPQITGFRMTDAFHCRSFRRQCGGTQG